jgi:hypothetical protein
MISDRYFESIVEGKKINAAANNNRSKDVKDKVEQSGKSHK